MKKEELRSIIYLLVSIAFSILAVNLFIWLLPSILIIILAVFIYNSINKRIKKKEENFNKNKTKNKKIIIIDSEDNN